jgi:hypothetical protein
MKAFSGAFAAPFAEGFLREIWPRPAGFITTKMAAAMLASPSRTLLPANIR